MVNFVTVCLPKIIFSSQQSKRNKLLLDTEVRWLSKVNMEIQVAVMKDEVTRSWKNKAIEFVDQLTDDKW